jgi:hypothetical protein
MSGMKLGTFIFAALCAASASRVNAAPTDDLLGRAAARSAAHDHAGAIALYREAYGLASDPHVLTLIGDELRLAGKPREALQYYCSYLYVDAAGDDADLASQYALELSARLGKPATSDHDACNDKAPAVPSAVTGVEALDIDLPPQGPAISKREIVGLSMLATGIGGLGVALYEGREVARVRAAQRVNDPTVDQDALQAQAESHILKQKVWLVGGGVTLLTGGILYVIGRNERHKAEKAMIAPTVNKNGGGLVVGRKF